MKTFTQSFASKLLQSTIVFLLVVTNSYAQFGTQNNNVTVRIPEEEI